jgi:hypothetical protein
VEFMARNDVVLLDSLVDKSHTQFGETLDKGELFEMFCFDNILKDYDLSHDEIETGWVDGEDDAGIDGIYTFIDSKLVTDEDSIDANRRNPLIECYVITAKHSDSFQQSPLDKVLGTLPVLFDLRTSINKLPFPINSDLMDCLDLFRKAYIGLVEKHPTLKLNVIYACRGDADSLPNSISSRGEHLVSELRKLFSNAEVQIEYLGASELLRRARRTKVYSLRLRFTESYISRESTNYVVVSLLPDYYRFVTDNEGHLRRYLFESNVRDYLGGQINRDIYETLQSKSQPDKEDFWWLNNGITLLASSATVAGKELSLENVQIVNGLQTTETIYNYFTSEGDMEDRRGLLIKIIITDNEVARDRIIKATNYQNAVETASLRATDKIHRDIEQYFDDHGWFYDRRKGFHKNQGRPADRIVAISYLGAAVRAIVLRDPVSAIERKTRWMRKDETYRQIFNEKFSVSMYLTCLEIVKTAETLLRGELSGITFSRGARRSLAPLISLMYVQKKLQKKDFKANEVAKLEGILPTKKDVIDMCKVIQSKCDSENRGRPNTRSRQFVDDVLKLI